MTDCFRLAVQKELVTRLAVEIPTLAGALFRGRATFGDNDPDLCGSLLEDPREFPVQQSSTEQGRGRKSEWRLLLQGWVTDDRLNPTDPAHQLAADYQRGMGAIRDAVRTDGFAESNPLSPQRKVNRVEGISIGAPIVRPPDDYSSRAYCWLPLTLTLIEDPQRPFT